MTTTLSEIKREIERLTDRRSEVLRQLSQGHDSVLAREHQELEDRIAKLWEDERAAKATLRFGDRNLIIQRARQEERLSRAA